MDRLQDVDPLETREWVDSLESVLEVEGPERAHFLLEQLVDKARRSGAYLPYSANTAYINTIPAAPGSAHPGRPGDRAHAALDRALERDGDGGARGKKILELGGHIASFASAATLYDVGFNHFWHAPARRHGGDLVYLQGHSSPGIYARAFLEGRITEEQLDHFRQEVDGHGIPSYPHPWLMPDFWQFPTVSMGLGRIKAIYQARFLRYLEGRGLAKTAERRKCGPSWATARWTSPNRMGAIGMAAREGLDNLIFVVNCNLQRLDGPVRGNGKIIQELEADFRGAGWNVIKVIWGSYWDPLLARDQDGLLQRRMEEAVDGEYQTFKSRDGAYVREHFFGKYPELKARVASMSDGDIWRLNRGGHDPHKIYAAYAAAMKHQGQPTVILAKTVKGYGMGAVGEGKNIAHQQKKMPGEALRQFRDRFNIPIPDDKLAEIPYYRPPEKSPEMQYLRELRAKLGGSVPQRRRRSRPLEVPKLEAFKPVLEATAEGREISTTMAFVRCLGILVKDKNVGRNVVPIVPDESRTFGMEGLFRQLGIYSAVGQLYEPEDSDQLMFYKEDRGGQMLQEGINEAGAMCSWMAAATSYSNNDVPMIPFYIFYSMFGLQRIGDLVWASGDIRARGFLLGGTSGRTTLNGEGLQHEDGHSQVLSSVIPNCISYDPTFGFEVAVILQDGLRRMMQEQEDVFYYITLLNENYPHPALPDGANEGILRGMYKLIDAGSAKGPRAQLLGSGSILREAIAARELLQDDWGVAADVWSCPSFTELRREGIATARWNLLHPAEKARVSYVERCLGAAKGPVVAATDYVRTFADQIREFVPRRYKVLGTDGFGRSDSRANLRRFFEVNRYYIALAALRALAEDGEIPAAKVAEALKKYGIDPEKPAPWTV